MIRGLHAVLTAVWHSGVGRPYLGNQEAKTSRLQQLLWNNTAQRNRQGACPFAADADPHSPVEAPET